MWHYFVDDIYFSEYGMEEYTPYTVTVNVKEKSDGTFVYSFNAEKTKESSTRRTIHADVNAQKGVNGELFIDSIPQTEEKSNSFDKKTSDQQDALDLGNTHKQAQFDIIQETNPMGDDYHVGIRSENDIRTWDDVLKLDDEREGQFVWGDFTRADAEQALKNGKVTVYSSYPIKNGVFVSTSYVQAEEYAGGRGGKVYSKTVPLDKVAWINGDEGQYADVKTSSGKQYALDIDSEEGNISGAEVMSWLNKKPETANKTNPKSADEKNQNKKAEEKGNTKKPEIKEGIEILVPTFEDARANIARTFKQLKLDVS